MKLPNERGPNIRFSFVYSNSLHVAAKVPQTVSQDFMTASLQMSRSSRDATTSRSPEHHFLPSGAATINPDWRAYAVYKRRAPPRRY